MTTAPSPAVERATPATRPDVVAALAAAFATDPVFTWIEPDPTARRAVLPAFFGAFADAYARHDATDVARIDGAAVGGALWAPPGVEAVHPDDADGLEGALAQMAPAAVERVDAYMEAFAPVHPETPAWYLTFMGVDPAQQCRGAGSTLLRAVLDGCDQRGEPAYVEPTSAHNRALYERHGFRVLQEVPLPDGPVVHAMWRDARPPGEA